MADEFAKTASEAEFTAKQQTMTVMQHLKEQEANLLKGLAECRAAMATMERLGLKDALLHEVRTVVGWFGGL